MSEKLHVVTVETRYELSLEELLEAAVETADDSDDDFWSEYAKENLSESEQAEAEKIRREAEWKRFCEEQRRIEAEIKVEMTNLRNRIRVRKLEVFSPAGFSEYRVRFEAVDHGHQINSPLMPKAEVAEWLRSVN